MLCEQDESNSAGSSASRLGIFIEQIYMASAAAIVVCNITRLRHLR